MLSFYQLFICFSLLSGTLHFAAVDVIDDIMWRTTIDGAPDRLRGAQDLLDGS